MFFFFDVELILSVKKCKKIIFEEKRFKKLAEKGKKKQNIPIKKVMCKKKQTIPLKISIIIIIFHNSI